MFKTLKLEVFALQLLLALHQVKVARAAPVSRTHEHVHERQDAVEFE